MQKQIQLSLPELETSQSLATLLDPAAKKFLAKSLLPNNVYEDTGGELKKEHRKLYVAWKTGKKKNISAQEVDNTT